jgi:hypothetical protein
VGFPLPAPFNNLNPKKGDFAGDIAIISENSYSPDFHLVLVIWNMDFVF